MNSLQKQKLLSQQLFATGSKGDRLHRHQTETQIQRRKKIEKQMLSDLLMEPLRDSGQFRASHTQARLPT